MSSKKPGGMKCHMHILSCLFFIQWALYESSISCHASTSVYKSPYKKFDYLLQETIRFSHTNQHQRLLETSVLTSSPRSYAASVPTPAPMPALFPSNPPETVPYSPAPGSAMVPTGNCSINSSEIEGTFFQTAADCIEPFAEIVGVTICCPQLDSLFKIMQGKHISATGALGLNNTEAEDCFSETVDALDINGLNLRSLCSVGPKVFNMGSCPVTTVTEFELVGNTSSLLEACLNIEIKECSAKTCQYAIGNATLDLALGQSDKMADCEPLVVSWIASQTTPDQANNVLRLLSSCSVNQVCPLNFRNTSALAQACNGTAPANTICCAELDQYAQHELQSQMLITNLQAYKCASALGVLLEGQGVTADIYSLCTLDLRDFSLQAQGTEGCLLPSKPLHINITTGNITFVCDLNDNILAQWPGDSSYSATPLGSPSASILPSRGTSLYIGSGLKTICAILTVMFLSLIIS